MNEAEKQVVEALQQGARLEYKPVGGWMLSRGFYLPALVSDKTVMSLRKAKTIEPDGSYMAMRLVGKK